MSFQDSATKKTASVKQQQLEQESIDLGKTRYHGGRLGWSLSDQAAVAEADSKPGRILVQNYVSNLSAAIEQWKGDVSVGKARRQASVLKFLKEIDAGTTAMLTLRGIINGFAHGSTLQDVSTLIVHPIINEINHRRLTTAAPGYAVVLLDILKHSSSSSIRVSVTKNAMKKASVQTLTIDIAERQRIANLLLDLTIESTGICTTKTISRGKGKSSVVVMPTPETAQWLATQHARCELLSPILLPMVDLPKPWTTPTDGGYYSRGLPLSLVKSLNKNYMEELRSWDMPEVYKAVNAIQSTPWKINTKILSVMREVWDSGRTLGKLPSRDPLPLPAKPGDIDTNEDALRAWKREAAKTHEANNKLVSKRVVTSQKLWFAEKFKDEPQIYFPHVLDWRGRVYPAAGVGIVNPQGDDTGKSLLHFAEGKRLGEEGAYWLACHIAGLFGVDKVPFDDRVSWVEDHSFELCLCAQDPLEYQFWTTADKPYQALAAIFEWEGFQLNGIDHVSHLPIAMDGSNNGAQHLSAMGRDARATVNLVPSDTPQDIYMDVAKVVSELVAEMAQDGDEMALIWDGKITRSIAKRPVMTLCYGATVRGMAGQIEDEVRKSIAAGEPIITAEKIGQACNWLAGIIYPAIGQVTVAAVSIMDWLKDTAKVAASNDLPVRWTTPVGFPVLQHYRKTNDRVIESVIAGARTQLKVSVESEELNRRRQAAGISPNFVHSLDAAHLVSTVNAMADAGITDFAMIHDSYGCHAADVPVMNKLLRETFVRMYSEDVLEDFRQQIIEQLPNDLAEYILPVPPQGGLDVSLIQQSQFFFA